MNYNYPEKNKLQSELKKLLTELLVTIHLAPTLKTEKKNIIRRELHNLIQVNGIMELKNIVSSLCLVEDQKLETIKKFLSNETILRVAVSSATKNLQTQLLLSNTTSKTESFSIIKGSNLLKTVLKEQHKSTDNNINNILKKFFFRIAKSVVHKTNRFLSKKSLRNFYYCNQNRSSRILTISKLRSIL